MTQQKCTPILKQPIIKTGVYEIDGKYQYWLCVEKAGKLQAEKIGECELNAPVFLFNHWVITTNISLKRLILRLALRGDITITIDGTKPIRNEIDVEDFMRHNRLQQ